MKSSVFIATSLDGFIARSDGDIDWLVNPEFNTEGKDFGYEEFIETVDAIVMGRNSFDKVLTFDTWAYTKPVFVLTHRELEIPDRLSKYSISRIQGTPEVVVQELSEKGYSHLYIDGGKTIQNFLNSGLINELTITIIPVLIGEGIPLFGSLASDIKLKHLSSKSYSTGFVQNVYSVDS